MDVQWGSFHNMLQNIWIITAIDQSQKYPHWSGIVSSNPWRKIVYSKLQCEKNSENYISKCSIHLGVAIGYAPCFNRFEKHPLWWQEKVWPSAMQRASASWCHGVNIGGTKPWEPPEISWFIVVFRIKMMAKDSEKAWQSNVMIESHLIHLHMYIYIDIDSIDRLD